MLNTEDLRNYTGIGTGYTPEAMMARAADEIDRLRKTLCEIIEANPRMWEELSEPMGEFERWAKSRAIHALGELLTPNE
ncbi:hypothetical protein [Sulfuriferula multivorans]|nr:hypothetical protein [Sulfuriferula multivorans]